MKTPSKIIIAVALAGLAVAGGSAFTGGGLTMAPALDTQFIGGSVLQTIEGAAVESVEYTYQANTPGAAITNVTVTLVNPPETASKMHIIVDGTETESVAPKSPEPKPLGAGTWDDQVLAAETGDVASFNQTKANIDVTDINNLTISVTADTDNLP